jgi:hypothetical protein
MLLKVAKPLSEPAANDSRDGSRLGWFISSWYESMVVRVVQLHCPSFTCLKIVGSEWYHDGSDTAVYKN